VTIVAYYCPYLPLWPGTGHESPRRLAALRTPLWAYYGEESFASYAKDGRDLYLEYVFPEAGGSEDEGIPPWFGTWHPENRGGWVRVDEAMCVEFYDLDDGDTSAQAPGGPASSVEGSL
jgi:hypothetical protein